MNKALNEDINDNLRSNAKNITKANDIISKATTSYNFYKPKIKKDIMEKITNILNDKHNIENFDSCYLNGNSINNNNIYSNKYYLNPNNKNNLIKTSTVSQSKLFKPTQNLYSKNKNVLNYNSHNNHVNGFEDRNQILKQLKNEGIKALSPKNNANNNHFMNLFDNRFNIYKDANLKKMHMPYATSNLADNNENKIFTDKVNNEINENENNKKNAKNNYKLFYEQLNNPKLKQNKHSQIKESIENKAIWKIQHNKKADDETSPRLIKSKNPESANLFLTKFNMKTKDNLKINALNKNFSNSSSYKNKQVNNEYNKDLNENNKNEYFVSNKEVILQSHKKQIEQNVSMSIDLNKQADSSYHSLKNEFSFLLEKNGDNEAFNLHDIMNDVKMAQNKLSSECDDIENLLKFANDTKSKLIMHKTENRFFNAKQKSINNNINFDYKAYTNNINNMIVNRTNGYLKGISNSNSKNLNSVKKEKETKNLNNEQKESLNKANEQQNPSALSFDEYLLIKDNSKQSKKENNQNNVIKKPNKKRAFSDMNYEAILPHIEDNADKNCLQKKNLTSKNRKGTNIIDANYEFENQTNNYFMIKSKMQNKKEENSNDELIFNPTDLELPKRTAKQLDRIQPDKALVYESDAKSLLTNYNLNKLNIEEFKYDYNNKNIFDRKIQSIYTLDEQKYLGTDKFNIQKFKDNCFLQSKSNIAANKEGNINIIYNKNTMNVKGSNKNIKSKLEKEEEEEEEEKNNIYIKHSHTNRAFNEIKNYASKTNINLFNEIKNHHLKKNIIFESLEVKEDNLNNEENKHSKLYNNHQYSNGIHKKFSGSLNNFHKNKMLNIDSVEEIKKESKMNNLAKNNNNNKQKDSNRNFMLSNPFIKSNKNFVDKKTF